ncbi:MAG: L-seryl-tRNA(Sec) selenium transferase [Deltaproteobacteria bacterium]|nr:L-seryl-tRNA(Sec) selenium transferase [Deltaproteobacteria bacterium]
MARQTRERVPKQARELLRRLPRVDEVTAHACLQGARRRLGVAALTAQARAVLHELREAARAGRAPPDLDAVAALVAQAAGRALGRQVGRVINATGVLLHTGLGRAPLGAGAVQALAESAGRYVSLELELDTGGRGPRAGFAELALSRLSHAEDALVVNNNAAAVLLALAVLAAGRGVLVSRGELVEIGGGFRVPEVLARSGARLIEVGTTNRTRIEDYAQALGERDGVAAILRVHQANFRQIGFVERPPLAELCRLARQRGVVLVKDLGGGALVDLGSCGLPGEPTVAGCVEAGCDLVCFSCDKVLGGPQGGAIVGRAELVQRARRDPLARALRIGRLPLVALEATLASYLEGREDEVPALAALRRDLAEVRERAERWCRMLGERGVNAEPVEVAGAVGGGALAETPLGSVAAAVAADDIEAVAARLRAGRPAVIARIRAQRLLLDARTVLYDEDDPLIDAVVAAVGAATAPSPRPPRE